MRIIFRSAFHSIAILWLLMPTIHVRAQNPTIDLVLAHKYFREADSLCRRDAGKLWGVTLCGPMLLVDPKTRAVVANQADKQNVLSKNGNVFVGRLPAQVNVANTATQWAGVKWTMVVFPLPEDKIRRASLLAHESWHRVQDDIGFPGSHAANNHLDSRDGRVWLQLEWRALSAALLSRGNQRRRAIADALLFRTHRRAIFPNATAEERGMEMHEGLAEYTGIKLSGSPRLDQYAVGSLKDGPRLETFVRSFAYTTGPAYGILLDETRTKWRENLKKEDDLGSLLQKKLSIRLPQNIKQTAELRAKNYDGDSLQATETEREDKRRKLLAEYRAKLIDGAVLILPIVRMNMRMNPGTLVPLEPVGTVYPDIRIVDAWGILTVTKGALIKSDFSRIYVSAPTRLSASPIEGDGWTLEPNTGWTIASGERKGDYVIRRND